MPSLAACIKERSTVLKGRDPPHRPRGRGSTEVYTGKLAPTMGPTTRLSGSSDGSLWTLEPDADAWKGRYACIRNSITQGDLQPDCLAGQADQLIWSMPANSEIKSSDMKYKSFFKNCHDKSLLQRECAANA
eukprot:1157475-Pelagomonas_calceolata.AAC.5